MDLQVDVDVIRKMRIALCRAQQQHSLKISLMSTDGTHMKYA